MLLAVRQSDADDVKKRLCCLQSANLALSAVFMLELVIKHIALGLLGYWRQGFNVLDGIIVAASIAELGVTRKAYVTCRAANLSL